ncbi:MAG: DEAD/DEAH box helicase, partial [Candidatus Altiarchaeota archaeon]|nr:DEAD/DEAH box helicase [Candidatus Altiarchaeota archaeon]
MKLSELAELHPELAPHLDKFEGVTELYPPQVDAIKRGVLDNKNFLLASGTASGKTLIATLASIKTVLDKKKVVYLAPLRALAFEKYREFKKFPFEVRISVGDFDSGDRWLGDADIIVCTYEKLDALLRHRPEWVRDIGLIIVDEVHEMGNRPVIETLITKMSKSRKILALSATVGNAQEMAEWMNADLLESDFRPVPLREGVFTTKVIHWADGSKEKPKSEVPGLIGLIEDSLERKYQTLIFANTRRGVEAQAEVVASLSEKYLTKAEKQELEVLSNKVLEILPHKTRQCERLAKILASGGAFHHAGLVNEQRLLVEDAFRAGLVKVLVSTVTLVAGINLPSRRVVIRNLKWFKGMWPVSLYKQAVGRAGRPGYNEEGEALVNSGNPAEVFSNYVNGQVEDVQSKLAYEPTMRKEILGLFASGFAFTEKDIENFMEQSFYAHQFGNAKRVKQMGMKILTQLISWGFLEDGAVVKVTEMGRRVAELYIDPFTAMGWIDKFEPTSDFGYLHIACMSRDIRLPAIRRSEEEELMALMVAKGDELIDPPVTWDLDFELYIQALKLANIIYAWVNEDGEDKILERFGIAPGDLRNYLSNVEWLAHALEQVVETKWGTRPDL